MIQGGLAHIDNMKRDVKDTGKMIDQDNILLERINNRGEEVNRTAERNNNRMENYLEKTSNCQLYTIIAFELLVFLILMSL